MNSQLLIGLVLVATVGGLALIATESTAAEPVAAPGPDRALAPIRDEASPSRSYLGHRNLPSHGVAIEGYCPVAYHAVGRPLRGKPAHSSDHDGVTYYFVSADAKRAFDESPARYVPAYGGWCAFGMAGGDKFNIDPLAFEIVDGRLMLFLRNSGVDARALWRKGDAAKLQGSADANWKKLTK